MDINRREFLGKIGLGALQVGLISQMPLSSWASSAANTGLPRSLPEAQGVSSKGILDFVNAVETKNLNLHSLIVVRHGNIVAEGWWGPYAPELKHTLYSLSKSFTSTAIGLAVAEGKLKVEDRVVSFFPKDLPATISPNLAAMRVKDLLTMSTGHDTDSTPSLRNSQETNWVKSFLALPVEHEPGTFFVYNSGATYMLSAIIQKLTGENLLTYLTPRLFKPLNIVGADWEVDPNGINTGGWGLRLKTEDIAKFGQLLIQKGMWNGKRLVAENWIKDATSSQVQSKGGSRKKEENDWLQGYGYQFWRCRHDAFRGDGAYGQYCIVLPKEDLVIAITSETADMQGILDQVWDHILPSLKTSVIAADKPGQAQLKQKLSTLALPLMKGKTTSEVAGKVSGKIYAIGENKLSISNISLTFKDGGCDFKIRDDKGEHVVSCGINKWKEGITDISTLPLKLTQTIIPGETKTKIAASGTWTDDNTFEMTWRFIETAHYEIVKCRFDKGDMETEFLRSLAILGNTKDARPVLKGKLVS
ncbi:CubicO group peptidase, beta-lactamase class C family [Dyadobacter koreensis]|uniref:CubicO group peptidase, beta-lactamase class C family n=1 Tax=Dyadobacter koreensis TaxID=408657 RepID=A0A1H6RNW6_9BACT|nr:serine hydrolase [Dyadobacter koreensis]SEI53285.1 CubicO group peptidase, beta-lactamase class C family [Dyadobacter koreensis]